MLSDHLQPAPFSYKDPNWKPGQWTLPSLKDSDPRELGYGGRDFQLHAFNQFNGKRRTIYIAPTGSGKSLVQVFCAAREIIESNWKQKQVFIVPQLIIGKGFAQPEKLNVGGSIYEWNITINCCKDNKDSVKRIKTFLLSDKKYNSDRSNNKLSGVTAAISYAALVAAWKNFTEDEKQKAIKTTSFRLDEGHHIEGVEEERAENEIGNFVWDVLKYDGSLHITTATFFRGNQHFILDDLDKFEVFRVPFLEHWNTLGLKELRQDYKAYKDAKDLSDQILKDVAKEKKEHHLIYLPPEGHSFFRTVDKWKYVKQLVIELRHIYPGKVLDLISPDRQYRDKERLQKEEQDFKVVVTCSIGREGMDWPCCSRIHNTVLDGNVLMPIQKLGRGLRQCKDKIDLRMINYIEHFASWDQDKDKLREIISDRFNAVMVASMWDDMFYPILMAKLPSDKEKEPTQKVTLEDIFGDLRSSLIEDLVREVIILPTINAETVDVVIEEILKEYESDALISISHEDLVCRLRQELLRRFNPANLDLRMKGMDVSWVREHWDKIVNDYITPNSPYVGITKTDDLKELKIIWINRVTENKKILLKMAMRGDPKPKNGSVLYHALHNYTSKNSKSYDPIFDKEIRQTEWFIDTVTENKKILLKMAMRGDPKPKNGSVLYNALYNYTSKNSKSYDPIFDKEIRQTEWFIDTVTENKKILLKMAMRGDPKPKNGSVLYNALYNYTCKNSKSYDPIFDKEIRQTEWFIDTVTENKKILLKMAMRGDPKPKNGSVLYNALYNYTSKNSKSYDPIFDKEIRQTEWFKR